MSAFDAKSFLKTVSDKPGVYRMMDVLGDIIYVGKAKSLKKRLASYFRSQNLDEKTRVLVKNIAQIEVIITHTETEALILEHNLIKEHRPRYNVLLRDDKSYPYLFLSEAKHPRLSFYRGAKSRKGEYFGPYPDSGSVRQSLYLLQKIFPVRQCEDSVYRNRTRPCLMYQIGRCAGPCVKGLVSDEAYEELVNYTRLFLQGKDQNVIALLVAKMEQASQALAFEKAAQYRDQIQALRRVQEQQFVSNDSQEDMDVIGVAFENNMSCVHVLFVRKGQVLGSRSYFPKMPINTSLNEVVSGFIGQFYYGRSEGRRIPRQILLDHVLSDDKLIHETALSELAGYKVHIQSHPRGVRARMLKLATTNALNALTSKINHKMTLHHRVEVLRDALGLASLSRMECFDISHTMGEQTVASCVVFNQDGPVRQEYRRYNIKGITGGDDYAAMAQVLTRRYSKQMTIEKIPDIIFIDGGKGQLNRAWDIVKPFALQWPKIPLLLGVAKGTTRRPGLETLIKINGDTFRLPHDSPALHLIQHIRDESHDHAISGHRAKRAKVKKESVLQDIEGVGPKRRKALLTYLGGMQGLKRASVEEIAKVPGISRVLAEKIYSTLQEL